LVRLIYRACAYVGGHLMFLTPQLSTKRVVGWVFRGLGWEKGPTQLRVVACSAQRARWSQKGEPSGEGWGRGVEENKQRQEVSPKERTNSLFSCCTIGRVSFSPAHNSPLSLSLLRIFVGFCFACHS